MMNIKDLSYQPTPKQNKENGACILAIGIMTMADGYEAEGKSRNDALTCAADMISGKIYAITDILREAPATDGK